MTYISGVDVSWPNGNYQPGTEAFVGIGAVSLDGGSPFVQSTYHEQVDNARTAAKEIIHYAFNGRTSTMSVAQFADYFVDNLYDYRPGDALALDVEGSEVDSSGVAQCPPWTPAQAQEFRDRVQSRIATRMGVYGYTSEMKAPGWGALHDTGTWLWIAWPGDESYLSDLGEWGSDWQIWQHGIANNVDQDYSKQTLAQLVGVTTKEEDEDMKSFLIYIKNTNGTMQWAHISADLRTFVPIWTQETANGISAGGPQTGPAVEVGKADWNAYRVAAGLPEDTTVG